MAEDVKPLIMRFNKDGYIKRNDNINVININNGVTFNQFSLLDNSSNNSSDDSSDKKKRWAYFPPYNKSQGLTITNTSNLIKYIKNITNNNNEDNNFTIYFKYKIHINDMEEITPIISFNNIDDNGNSNMYPLISIVDKKYFSFRVNDTFSYYTKNIEHTLNNECHTFCLTRMHNVFRFFIDGLLLSQYEWKDIYTYNLDNQNLSKSICIGYLKTENEKEYTFNNGCLDDICIYDKAIYKNSFAPPTNYFTGADSIENYKGGRIIPDKYYKSDEDLLAILKDIKSHTYSEANAVSKNFTSQKLNFDWSITDFCYVDGQLEQVSKLPELNNEYTAFNISDLSAVFISTVLHQNNEYKEEMFKPEGDEDSLFDYVDGTTIIKENSNSFKVKNSTKAKKNINYTDFLFYYNDTYINGMRNNILFPIILFVNNCFVKLSKLRIYKSNNYYTLCIHNSVIEKENIKTMDIILLPFQIVYKENLEKEKYGRLLYSFNENGEFVFNGATCFYYIKDKKLPEEISSKIPEVEAVSSDTSVSNNTSSNAFVQNSSYNIFHYIDNRIDETKAKYKGAAKDFLLQKDLVSVKHQKIASTTAHFTDSKEIFLDNTLILNKTNIDKLFGELSSSASLENTISKDITIDSNQYTQLLQNINSRIYYNRVTISNNLTSIIDIPFPKYVKHIDSRYIKFLLFKYPQSTDSDNELKLLTYSKEFEIDYNKNTIRIKNKNEFLNENDKLLFIFIIPDDIFKNTSLYIEPLYLSLDPSTLSEEFNTTLNSNVTSINISNLPIYKNLDFSNNIIAYLFKNGEIISPDEYIVKKNEISFESPLSSSDITNITICLFQIKDNINYPISEKDIMFSNAIKEGKRFILYDLGIPGWYNITLDSLICFDQEGKYISDVYGHIYGLNVIKYLYTSEPMNRIVKDITCIYNTKYFPLSYNNINNFTNDLFLRKYLTLQTSSPELDKMFYDLINEFDFIYSKNLSKEENISRALDYITTYNQNLFDPLYEKKSKTKRIKIDNSMITNGNTCTLSLDTNTNNSKTQYETHRIFFINGKLTNDIEYDNENNEITISLPNQFDTGSSDSNSSNIEIFETRDIQNFLFSIDPETYNIDYDNDYYTMINNFYL